MILLKLGDKPIMHGVFDHEDVANIYQVREDRCEFLWC